MKCKYCHKEIGDRDQEDCMRNPYRIFGDPSTDRRPEYKQGKKWKSFWFESNAAWGKANNKKDWEREIERDFRGVAHGVSRRVDKLKALGNAIVPQVAANIMECIKTIEMELNE